MPLRSKPLALLIENSSNKNSSQLADNKQKRPVLIENFEPNRARVFAPLYPEALRRGMLSRGACPRVLSRLDKASSLRAQEIEKPRANESAHELSRSPHFVEAFSKKLTCLNHSFRAASPARVFVSSRPLENWMPSTYTFRAASLAREAAFLTGLPAVFSEGLARAFFAKGSACSNTFLTGSGSQTEIDVTRSKQRVGTFLTGARTAHRYTLNRTCGPSQLSRLVSGQEGSQPRPLASCEFPGIESLPLQPMWLMEVPSHLTNCRLNRLQLFRSAGVCTNRHMEEITACADKVCIPYSEASFAVE